MLLLLGNVGVRWHDGNARQAVNGVAIYLFDLWISGEVSLASLYNGHRIGSPCALLQYIKLGEQSTHDMVDSSLARNTQSPDLYDVSFTQDISCSTYPKPSYEHKLCSQG